MENDCSCGGSSFIELMPHIYQHSIEIAMCAVTLSVEGEVTARV